MRRILTLLILAASPAFASDYILETSVITDWETISYYGSQEEAQKAIDAAIAYTSEPEVVVTIPPVTSRSNGGAGSIGMLSLQALGLFVVFRMWLSQCWLMYATIRADTPDNQVVKAMAIFWGMIALMIYLVYLIISNIIGMV